MPCTRHTDLLNHRQDPGRKVPHDGKPAALTSSIVAPTNANNSSRYGFIPSAATNHGPRRPCVGALNAPLQTTEEGANELHPPRTGVLSLTATPCVSSTAGSPKSAQAFGAGQPRQNRELPVRRRDLVTRTAAQPWTVFGCMHGSPTAFYAAGQLSARRSSNHTVFPGPGCMGVTPHLFASTSMIRSPRPPSSSST